MEQTEPPTESAPSEPNEAPDPPEPPKVRGKKRKARVPRDVSAPRQPLTGYVRYLNERRETLRADNPRLGFAEVTRRLAGEWSRLPADEKRQYLLAAEQDRERYVKEWSAYKETDAYKAFRQMKLERKADAPPPPAKKATVNGEEKVKPSTSPAYAPNNSPEVDVPIFTDQFLQHNKLRETELRQLRKANSDYQQQNAILQKRIENMRGVVDRTKAETVDRAARASALRSHLTYLTGKLVTALGMTALPGGPDGATEQNLEQYMERLHAMAVENKSDIVIKQARELLSKIDVA